jgi:serine/threonine protein kinase
MTNLIALPSGTELVGDYRIERVLGAGGFGVTYLADEIALARLVTIKEYFPGDIAARTHGNEAAPRSKDCAGDYGWGLDRFIEEAQTLAKFNHTNIVRVYRYFRANNTGYMVLHFEEGQSLKAWLKGLKRAPRQKELDAILGPLLDALEYIHKSDYLHRDIAPDNIIIRKSGDPVLIDFGSARGEIASHTKTVSALVKPGYSPYEQYAETSRQQGPWTDIYALGATLYHAVTGKRPPDAPSRMVNDEYVCAREAAVGSYRAGFLSAIDRALSLSIEARPQAIAAWRGDLLAPDAPRTGWLNRALEKKKDEHKDVTARDSGAALADADVAVLPPPDVPGPKGRMLDLLDGMRKKTEAKSPPAPAKVEAAPAAKAKPPPAPGPQVKGPQVKASQVKEPQAKTPQARRMAQSKPPKKSKPDGREVVARRSAWSPAPKGRALVPVRAAKPPRPRPVRGSRRRWASLAFKLLVGVGVASAAVAMQDRFPHPDSPGVSAPITGSTKALQRRTSDAGIIAPIAEITAHSGAVSGLAYTDDGRWIVTTGADATLKVWEAGSQSLVRTLALDEGTATALALSGTRALTGHANGKAALWDLQTAQRIATFQRGDAGLTAVAFAGAATRVATASNDGMIALWDVAQPSAPLHVFDGHEKSVEALAYTPERSLLLSGGADKTMRLWDLPTLTQKRRYGGPRDMVSSVAFSHNGRLLAGGALDGRVRVWSVLSSRRLRTLRGHTGRVAAIAFAPHAQTLASAGSDGTVRLWDLKRGRTIRALTGHTGGATGVAFAPDGERLATAGANGMVRLWAMPLDRLAKD